MFDPQILGHKISLQISNITRVYTVHLTFREKQDRTQVNAREKWDALAINAKR